jgi:hypothetical protein
MMFQHYAYNKFDKLLPPFSDLSKVRHFIDILRLDILLIFFLQKKQPNFKTFEERLIIYTLLLKKYNHRKVTRYYG